MAFLLVAGAAPADEAMSFDSRSFTLELNPESQTVEALQPKGVNDFDFTPADWLDRRKANGFHHLGDLTLRLREGDSGKWIDYDTSTKREPVTTIPTAAPVLAAADLSPTLPADCPVTVKRTWLLDDDGNLTLRFEVANSSDEPVEIGGLGIPMVFNNIIIDRNLEQAHAACSLSDPYIGEDAGYLQVTRLTGKGPALLVVPEADTPFEAYRPLDEPLPRQQTFEGMLEWTVHSKGYADEEWAGVKQWNPPTSVTLGPDESRTYGVKFLLAPEIRDIEKTLVANNRPVAVGIPGYVLPMDIEGRLFLNYGSSVESIECEPAGAISIAAGDPTPGGWQAFTLHGKKWGRARILVTYEDGTQQAVHYNVIKPEAEVVSDMGNFLMTKQWFVDPQDPFHRSPSVISYDREANEQVTQESRVWIAGLGDEGGTGAWVAAAMKEFGQPDPAEAAKFEQFIDEVLWGTLQFKDGPLRYGVKKSAFYYDPKALPEFPYREDLDWTTWTSWNKQASGDIGRGYNYPHVVAAYWAMYRIARNHPGLVKNHDWKWYLNQAYETTRFAFSRNERGERRVGWVELGLMEGTIFLKLLEDLQHEGWTEQAGEVEALMKERADRWKDEAFPFGSEMPWDSTGQEEVYAWCDYFGHDDKAQVTLDAIVGYMPTIPHWGYNGNARRYWDFLYGGKLPRIERQIHHYGSGLNAIPVLSAYRETPDDIHLLRMGYGGIMGALTNVDEEGFPSAAFHSYPSTLKWDAYSGDYGPNFLGHALNTGTYVVNHPEFGWQAFGGNVTVDGDWIRITPRDSFRSRVYLATQGLWLTLDAGTFEAVELNPKTGAVRLGLSPKTATIPAARLRIEQPAKTPGVGNYKPATVLKTDAGAYAINLGPETTWIELEESP